MTLVHLAHLTSHLQNASKARLGLTSTPWTSFNLAMLVSLQRAGFLSFVTRGGPVPPDPSTLSTYEPEPLTTANVARQRLWVGLKYSNNAPVMKQLSVISRPTRPVTAKLAHLERLARGWDDGPTRLKQRGLNIGECMFVSTPQGIMEVREAVERKMGGLLLCRVSP
ncbi:mitochondrial 37S ribosomal protein S8 [Xylariales sp. PMI_506]|nr:mitochondrial 37S ribosomal protein S8 [Xylariales sp. PMI_506]